MSLAFLFLPDEWIPIIIVGLVVGVVLGIVRIGWAVVFILALALSPVTAGIIEDLLAHVPLWLQLIIIILFALYVLRLVLGLALGEAGAGAFIGRLAYDLFTIVFRSLFFLVVLPFRLLGRVFRYFTRSNEIL